MSRFPHHGTAVSFCKREVIWLPRLCGHLEAAEDTGNYLSLQRQRWLARTGRSATIRCRACVAADLWPAAMLVTGTSTADDPPNQLVQSPDYPRPSSTT